MILSDDDVLTTSAHGFSQDYKDKCFLVWYNQGKPGAKDLIRRIPFPETNMGNKPTVGTLNIWVSSLFIPRGKEMDAEVQQTLNTALVQTKIEMLTRHIETGKQMQNMALDYLEKHKDELSANAAVRLLIEGIRVERESTGIPGAIEKIIQKSDDDLAKEVYQILQSGEVEYDFDEGE